MLKVNLIEHPRRVSAKSNPARAGQWSVHVGAVTWMYFSSEKAALAYRASLARDINRDLRVLNELHATITSARSDLLFSMDRATVLTYARADGEFADKLVWMLTRFPGTSTAVALRSTMYLCGQLSVLAGILADHPKVAYSAIEVRLGMAKDAIRAIEARIQEITGEQPPHFFTDIISNVG